MIPSLSLCAQGSESARARLKRLAPLVAARALVAHAVTLRVRVRDALLVVRVGHGRGRKGATRGRRGRRAVLNEGQAVGVQLGRDAVHEREHLHGVRDAVLQDALLVHLGPQVRHVQVRRAGRHVGLDVGGRQEAAALRLGVLVGRGALVEDGGVVGHGRGRRDGHPRRVARVVHTVNGAHGARHHAIAPALDAHRDARVHLAPVLERRGRLHGELGRERAAVQLGQHRGGLRVEAALERDERVVHGLLEIHVKLNRRVDVIGAHVGGTRGKRDAREVQLDEARGRRRDGRARRRARGHVEREGLLRNCRHRLSRAVLVLRRNRNDRQRERGGGVHGVSARKVWRRCVLGGGGTGRLCSALSVGCLSPLVTRLARNNTLFCALVNSTLNRAEHSVSTLLYVSARGVKALNTHGECASAARRVLTCVQPVRTRLSDTSSPSPSAAPPCQRARSRQADARHK